MQLSVPFWASIVIIVIGLILLIFPAKFGNTFFGPKIKSVLENENKWKTGQTYNALLYIFLGSASLLYVLFDTRRHALIMLLMLIILYGSGIKLIDRIIKNRKV